MYTQLNSVEASTFLSQRLAANDANSANGVNNGNSADRANSVNLRGNRRVLRLRYDAVPAMSTNHREALIPTHTRGRETSFSAQVDITPLSTISSTVLDQRFLGNPGSNLLNRRRKKWEAANYRNPWKRQDSGRSINTSLYDLLMAAWV